MDLRKIKKLIELLEESGIAEIEVKEGEESIKLSRASQVQQPIINTQTHDVSTPISPTIEKTIQKDELKPDPVSDGDTIDSPMVGTFYRAAAPGEDPFVDLGSEITIGQTICILEAMKLMNEIESEFNAEIVEILVENGTPVEFGQVLMRVKQS